LKTTVGILLEWRFMRQQKLLGGGFERIACQKDFYSIAGFRSSWRLIPHRDDFCEQLEARTQKT
jgi:hypothetical protein